MKESIVNLLVFCLLFAAVVLFVVGAYFVYNTLVPGGRGLIFASPYAAALFPGLLSALVITQYRSVRRPGRFAATWLFLYGAFLALLLFAVPLIQKAPALRAPDALPLVAGQFLQLEDGGSLLSPPGATNKGQFLQGLLLVPGDATPMTLVDQVPYDPLNHRFLLPEAAGGAKGLPEAGVERTYFQYPDFYQSVQSDLFAVYLSLRTAWEADQVRYLALGAALGLLFLGNFFFFSLKTWPLVQIIVVLIVTRLDLWFLAYSLHSLPLVIEGWTGPAGGFWQAWLPVGLVAVAGAALFFMTVLTKPHRVEALT